MTRKKVWRYYCEFCKRSGCSGGHIRNHEASCTANPLRECRFHSVMRIDQPTMPALIAALQSCGNDFGAGLKALREVADNCPACILAAIRQTGLNAKLDELWGRGEYSEFTFQFKDEVADFWQHHPRPSEGD